MEFSSAETFLTILAALLGFLVYFYAPSWSVRKVPGPPVMPLLGHLPLLAKYGPDVFSNLAKRYGPVFRFHMGRQPLVIIADAELVREVGIRKFKSAPNRSIPSALAASPLHTKGLFATKDSRWSAMRNTVVSVYQPSHLAKLIPMMQESIEGAAERLDSSETVSFSDLSLKTATDVIGKAAFGVDFGLSKTKLTARQELVGKEEQEFIQQHIYSTTQLKMDLSGSFSIILGLIIPFLQEPFRQILKRIPGTKDWRFELADKILCARLNSVVEKRLREKTHRQGSKDFLSLVLAARDSETAAGKVFTDDYVTAVTYEHLLAGSTTTSFTLSAVLYLVSGHPEVETKLLQEIDMLGPHEQIPTAHDLQHKLPYLDQVIKESMRFYTVSPLIAREASAEIEVGGYVLPKGTWLWLAVGVLAKDPRNFPDPEKFRPERFDPSCEEEKRRHPYAHIPFGIGPRACIGQKFSLQELKLSLIHLYRNYTFKHSPEMEDPLEFEYGVVVNFKHGVKLRAIKRA